MPPNPPSKRVATPCVASPPLPLQIIVGPPWQIRHTPMNYYWEIYLRIHPGRQLIVCSSLRYMSMHYKIFLGVKKWLRSYHNISWNALHGHCFQNTMCPLLQCLSKLMGEQHYKRVSEKNRLFIIFWEDFLPWKWLKIALKTHEIAPFFKIFLGGGMPLNPPSKGSQLRCSRHAASRHV